jgi:hypothetical protein
MSGLTEVVSWKIVEAINIDLVDPILAEDISDGPWTEYRVRVGRISRHGSLARLDSDLGVIEPEYLPYYRRLDLREIL